MTPNVQMKARVDSFKDITLIELSRVYGDILLVDISGQLDACEVTDSPATHPAQETKICPA